MKKDILCLIFCFMFLWIAVKPLFHPGLFPTIDNISVTRMQDMARELRAGQFPVRHSSTLARERGYMLFNFYAPLPYYVGAAQILIGINPVGALKRTFFIAFCIGLIGAYLFSKEFFGRFAGMVSAIVFVFTPYIGFDTFWRGGLGEMWAIALLPYLFWSTYQLIRSWKNKYLLVVSAVLAGIALSHNLTGFMTVPFLSAWILYWWSVRGRRHLSAVVGAGVLGLGLASFFWLPAFMEKSFVWVSLVEAANVFELLAGREMMKVLFPTFIPMVTNWWIIIVPFIGLGVLFFSRKINSKRTAMIVGALFLCSLVMTSILSYPVWKIGYPLLYIFLFPWRFYVMATVFGSLLIGGIVTATKKKWRYALGIVIIGIAIGVNLPNFRPTTYEFVDQYRPEDPCGTSYGTEYFPTWITTCLKKPPTHPFEIAVGRATVAGQKLPQRYNAVVVSDGPSVVRVQEYFYPGWQALLDGAPTQLSFANKYGLIDVSVPDGKHTLVVQLKDTPLRTIANMFSVISIIIWCIIAIYEYKKSH